MSSKRADEERAIREANAVFRGEWDSELTAADVWSLVAVIVLGAVLIFSQSC